MPPLRIYIDTSVVGGVFDDGIEEESLRIFSLAREGRIRLLLSSTLFAELENAPAEVAENIDSLPPHCREIVPDTPEADRLWAAYMREKVVPAKYEDDAIHVANATVSRADAIVSWNFKHLVNTNRIAGFNAVNQAMGFPAIRIISPPGLEC